MNNMTNLSNKNEIKQDGFSIFINAEVATDEVKYDQMFVPVEIKWNTNFNINSYDYIVQEYVSYDYKKTWILIGNSDKTIYNITKN